LLLVRSSFKDLLHIWSHVYQYVKWTVSVYQFAPAFCRTHLIRTSLNCQISKCPWLPIAWFCLEFLPRCEEVSSLRESRCAPQLGLLHRLLLSLFLAYALWILQILSLFNRQVL
jgi:hypothetical protein